MSYIDDQGTKWYRRPILQYKCYDVGPNRRFRTPLNQDDVIQALHIDRNNPRTYATKPMSQASIALPSFSQRAAARINWNGIIKYACACACAYLFYWACSLAGIDVGRFAGFIQPGQVVG